jgi:hypothetical protein
VPFDVQVSEEISAMPPDLALALYRASELALVRMLRKPPPRHVELIAELEDGRLLLTLRASGLGEPGTVEPQAVVNLQHWLGRHAGTLAWSDAGGSALLRAEAPVVALNAGVTSPGSRSAPAAR